MSADVAATEAVLAQFPDDPKYRSIRTALKPTNVEKKQAIQFRPSSVRLEKSQSSSRKENANQTVKLAVGAQVDARQEFEKAQSQLSQLSELESSTRRHRPQYSSNLWMVPLRALPSLDQLLRSCGGDDKSYGCTYGWYHKHCCLYQADH